MIVSIVNQKGGVGKTTVTTNLAVSISYKIPDSKVLVIDIDPQANSTDTLLHEQVSSEQSIASIFELQPFSKPTRIFETRFDNVHLIPSNLSLSHREFQTKDMVDAEYRLKGILAPVKNQYTHILIDCPPSLGLFTINALVASDHVLIPTHLERYAILGINDLLDVIEVVQAKNPNLSILGILPYMVDKRFKVHNEMLGEIRMFAKQIGIPYLQKQTISTNAQLRLAASARKTIHEQNIRVSVYKQFNALATWLKEQV